MAVGNQSKPKRDLQPRCAVPVKRGHLSLFAFAAFGLHLNLVLAEETGRRDEELP